MIFPEKYFSKEISSQPNSKYPGYRGHYIITMLSGINDNDPCAMEEVVMKERGVFQIVANCEFGFGHLKIKVVSLSRLPRINELRVIKSVFFEAGETVFQIMDNDTEHVNLWCGLRDRALPPEHIVNLFNGKL